MRKPEIIFSPALWVVDDVDLHGAKITPTKVNAPLVIDPNAVQPDPIPNQRLQTISWRRSKIRNLVRVRNLAEYHHLR